MRVTSLLLCLAAVGCEPSAPTTPDAGDATAAPEADASVRDVPVADAGARDVPVADTGAPQGPFVLRAAVDGENTDFSADASVYVLPSDPENIMLRGVRAQDGTLLSIQTNRLRDGGIGCSTMNLNYADGDRFFALGSDGDCVVTQRSVARNVGDRAEGTFSGRLRGGGIGDAGTRTISGGFYSFTRQ